MDAGVFVPIAFFGMIAAIVIVPKVLRSRDRDRLHETLRLAYEKGQTVPPELMDALQPGKPDADLYVKDIPVRNRSEQDLRTGVIWLAVGVGLLLVGAAFYAMLYNVGGAVETGFSFAALAAVPLCIGVAFLLLSAIGRKKPA